MSVILTFLKDQKISKMKLPKNEAQEQKNYCRICLEDSGPLKKLPCSCKGSLSYMHDSCLNEMLHVKIANQKQDVPDYIQSFSQNSYSVENVKAKCQICLHQIILEKQSKMSLIKIFDVQLQVYLVLFGISCISLLGLNIALKLLHKALQQTGLLVKILYFGAYVWIVGVILYVIIQPIYSEIKVTNFKIKNQNSMESGVKENKSKYGGQKWKKYLKSLIPSDLMRLTTQIKQKSQICRHRNKESKLREREKRKSRSQSGPRNKQIASSRDRLGYFQI